MFQALTIALALGAAGVMGQSSSGVPSGISKSCSEFYTSKLQASTSPLSSCLNTIINATSSSSPDLDTFCSSTSSCTDTNFRTTLSSFYAACSPELTSDSNKDVIEHYDTLYTLAPMRTAMCTRGDDSKYCLASMGSKYLNDQESTVQEVLNGASKVVSDDWKKYGVAFAFLNKDLEKETLCQPCTRKILTAYTTFESNLAYAPGLTASLLLSSQTALYSSVSEKCGADFLSGAVAAAGSLSGGSTDGALSVTGAGSLVGTLAAVVIGIVAAA